MLGRGEEAIGVAKRVHGHILHAERDAHKHSWEEKRGKLADPTACPEPNPPLFSLRDARSPLPFQGSCPGADPAPSAGPKYVSSAAASNEEAKPREPQH